MNDLLVYKKSIVSFLVKVFFVIKLNFLNEINYKSSWFSVLLFACTLLILFPFAFGTEIIKRYDVQVGCFWVVQEFICALSLLRMFSAEEEHDVFDMFVSSGFSRMAFFLGKSFFTAVKIFILQFLSFVVWLFLYNISFQLFSSVIKTFFFSCFLFSLGSAFLGAFISCITQKSQAKELLQPILMFPLKTGILLAAVNVCLGAEGINLSHAFSLNAWWSLLILYPSLFLGLVFVFKDVLFEGY